MNEKEWQRAKNTIVDQLKEEGNKNLAQLIKKSTADELSNGNKIEAWKEAFPESKSQLSAIRVKAETYIDDKEYYSPQEYFSRDSNGNLKFKSNLLAKELEEKYKFKYVEETDIFYVYIDNYWQDRAERVIQQECNKRLGDEYEPHYGDKVVKTIKRREYISVANKSEFQPCKYKIPFKNCTYNLRTGEREEHKPEDRFTHIIPWDLDRDAQCPRINEFLSQVVESESDKELILETIGYSLLADYPYEHSLIMYGGGKNGKTVLLELWKRLLSEENYKEEDLQQLEDTRFASRWLYRKLALFSDDMPATKLETGNTLKSLTGGGDTGAEIKGGDHFEFKNFATPVFACNEIPESNDDSDGFYRRWEIVNFPYKFVDNPKKENQKKKQPKEKLLDELTQESEIKGLVNEALVRLEMTKENGGIYHKTDADSTRSLWKSYSNPFQQFVENCLEQGLTQQDAAELDEDSDNADISEYQYDFIVKDDLVWLIGKYCEYYDKRPPTKTKVTQYLKNQSPYYVQEGRTRQLGSGNDRERVYKFIKFSDEFLDFVESNKKRPECPYFFEHLRAHARKVKRSIEKSRDSEDTSLSVGQAIKDFITEQSQELVEEQKIIEELDHDEQDIEKKISHLKRQGEIYDPKPGKVGLL